MPPSAIPSAEVAVQRVAIAAVVALPQMLDRKAEEPPLAVVVSEAVRVSEGVRVSAAGVSVAMVFVGATASLAASSSDRASTRAGTIRSGGPTVRTVITATTAAITRRRVWSRGYTGLRPKNI